MSTSMIMMDTGAVVAAHHHHHHSHHRAQTTVTTSPNGSLTSSPTSSSSLSYVGVDDLKANNHNLSNHLNLNPHHTFHSNHLNHHYPHNNNTSNHNHNHNNSNNNNNVPINFAMKFFSSNNQNQNSIIGAAKNSNSSQSSNLLSINNKDNDLRSSSPSSNYLGLTNGAPRNHLDISKSTSSHNSVSLSTKPNSTSPAAPTSIPQILMKLEPRVPSPCTADLALLNGNVGETTTSTGIMINDVVDHHSNKDLSFFIANSSSSKQSPTSTIASGPIASLTATTSSSSFVSSNGIASGDQINERDSQKIDSNNSLSSSGHDHLLSPSSLSQNKSTILCNEFASSPMLSSTTSTPPNKNPYSSQTLSPQFSSSSSSSSCSSSTPLSTSTSSTSATTISSMIHNGALKRIHDEAFGSTTNSIEPFSPSNKMCLTNGSNHLNINNSIIGAGVSMVASPTSSSYSDFSSACKEEMSPSNSVNGYTSVDSLGSNDPRKKKGPAPRQQEELCLVCGDRASGYHYNALTCEGCKGFFRRSITKNAVYQCKYGNNCEIDMYMRRKCQECRLKKCLSVGMRPECVVPEYQCAIKREAKRAIKDKDRPNSTTKDGLSPNQPQLMIEDSKPMTPLMSNNCGNLTDTNSINWNGSNLSNGGGGIISSDLDFGRKLTNEQDDIIKKLVYWQDEYESPSEEDIKKIAPFPLGDNEDDNQKRFQHVTEMTILTVQLIVEFSKRVPYFDTLFRDDQITLLKACSSEVMMLRCSRKYDIKTDSIVYANNQPYTRQNYSSACISYVADTLFNFCRRMHMLKVDNAEYALLTAIVIFSDRPHLLEPHKVEEIQEKYIETLRIYVENRRPPNKCHFAKLLGILTELRTLGNINSEMCVSLKVQNKKLPPFLAEIWDIQDS
ncbi:Ecdysone receptor [Sarcoptes scabiei]|nr:Ecdysone receptor [Sarcoptes scabiei]